MIFLITYGNNDTGIKPAIDRGIFISRYIRYGLLNRSGNKVATRGGGGDNEDGDGGDGADGEDDGCGREGGGCGGEGDGCGGDGGQSEET